MGTPENKDLTLEELQMFASELQVAKDSAPITIKESGRKKRIFEMQIGGDTTSINEICRGICDKFGVVIMKTPKTPNGGRLSNQGPATFIIKKAHRPEALKA